MTIECNDLLNFLKDRKIDIEPERFLRSHTSRHELTCTEALRKFGIMPFTEKEKAIMPLINLYTL